MALWYTAPMKAIRSLRQKVRQESVVMSQARLPQSAILPSLLEVLALAIS
nr:MAG TPA: hypothetical protein [Caudoviricetes sp.]